MAYNAAQTHEKGWFLDLLRDLCDGVSEPERQKNGRPRLPIQDVIFAACFKVYSTVSCRRFMSDLREAQAKGYVTRTPHFNSIFNYLENPELTPILRAMITERKAFIPHARPGPAGALLLSNRRGKHEPSLPRCARNLCRSVPTCAWSPFDRHFRAVRQRTGSVGRGVPDASRSSVELDAGRLSGACAPLALWLVAANQLTNHRDNLPSHGSGGQIVTAPWLCRRLAWHPTSGSNSHASCWVATPLYSKRNCDAE